MMFGFVKQTFKAHFKVAKMSKSLWTFASSLST